MKIVRWKAVVPMLLVAGGATLAWLLYVDVAIRRTIEFVGTEIVGARVELASARLRLRSADLVLKGLQVTDPNAPMRNLVEVPEIVADLNGAALLRRKVVVESVTVRGVRFGTPRRTSGALPDLPPTAGLVTRRVLSWAGSITVPSLDLAGLAGAVIRVPAINSDSLRTVRQARAVQAMGDSLGTAWEGTLRGLDPGPAIDSARALLERLRGSDSRRMNAAELASAAAEVRATMGRVNATEAQLNAAGTQLATGVAALRGAVGSLDAARQADYAWARNLVKIPSVAAPDVSMALFGAMVTERLKPFVYWFNLAEQYLPPGLDPRRSSGPPRLRMAGTDFAFPLEHAWPFFLVERAAGDLAVGGRTVAAGAYRAEVTGVTSDPALYGKPTFFSAERRSAVGPRELRVGGMMDRLGREPRDSVSAVVPGVQIPAFPVPGASASLDLGDSSLLTVRLTRSGAELSGTWLLESDAVRWRRQGADTAAASAAAPLGSPQWLSALLWRSVSTIPRVSIAVQVSGALAAPRVAVTSNVGDAVSASLRAAVGAEVQRAEQQVRAAVDERVGAAVAAARTTAAALETRLSDRVAQPAAQLAQLKADLQAQLDQLTRSAPGLRLPSLPGLPRRP